MLVCVFVRACVSLWFNLRDHVRLGGQARPQRPLRLLSLLLFISVFLAHFLRRMRQLGLGVTLHLESGLVPGKIISTISWTLTFVAQDSS